MSTLPASAEVVIVGGGLAGLAAARRLDRAGVDWHLVEGAERLGGRVATDVVDGFTLDRGFQILNTAYPRVPALVDLDALDLRLFASGVLVRRGGALHRLESPLRAPAAVPATLTANVGTFADRLRFAAFAARCATVAPRKLLAEPEVTAAEALRRAGLSHRIVEEVLRPFLSGVFADRALDTSSHVLAMVLRSFARGRLGVPASGMAALPAAVAAPLPPERLHLSSPVTAVRAGAVTAGGATITCRQVVVAADPVTACRLLDLPAPPMRALTTWYFGPAQPPITEPILLVDGDRRERLANTAVMSNAAPTYAPPGRALVAASAVGDTPLPEPVVREELTRLYGVPAADWPLLRVVALPHALPAAPPPLNRLRRPVALGDGVFVAGDHRDSPSIQGALAGGWRAAGALLSAV
ncbi:FAD-dependent oxidoreductase [Spirilliplanes yamanashiensis]|uniref:Oxidoreductase n=1 Tax=Spirilliplanes yamanashiensis TaxID=42233 RepID=A0A8J3YE72_9ACTN|nr:FAD-dependent oxidoreductase [Spirilliplanes yamanashiensis]MDP9816573.1 phytoene dehydrogenase-like protein [Spirilliplanes yamanashiensis]GIJ06100.1 oxidoreductase [Spirilliplanes yamanashiensis]